MAAGTHFSGTDTRSSSGDTFSLSCSPCHLCPRDCGADRAVSPGYCGQLDAPTAARAALHFWEEPCISGTRGSGTIFFTGCSLRCCFCQNYHISQENLGKTVTPAGLCRMMLRLQDEGAHNINLVTASHFLPSVLEALSMAKPHLHIPVVYNCGGYEKPGLIDALNGYVDIWLPDFKYFSPQLSKKYSGAADYFEVASRAILQMAAQSGPPVMDEDGLLKRGTIVRHMVLPGCKSDSFQILGWLADHLAPDRFLISLLSQYTPFYKSSEHPELNRRITSYEYSQVVEEALRLGFTNGFMQEKSSAKEEYTPPFDLTGID